MPSTTRPLGDAQSRTHWGAPKRCRSLSMTDESWDLLTQIAEFNRVNRSEAIERLIREAVKGRSLESPCQPEQVA